jgi:transposase
MSIPIEIDRRYKVNQKMVDEMRKLRKKGLSCTKIAKKFNVSYHTVYYWCNKKYRKYKQIKNAKRRYPKGEHTKLEVEQRRRRWKLDKMDYIIDAVQSAKDEKRCTRHIVLGRSIEEWDKILEDFKNGGQKVF